MRLNTCLFCLPCFSQHTDAKFLFSPTACNLFPSILLLCVNASRVSSVSVYLLLRPLTNFQNYFELVFPVGNAV